MHAAHARPAALAFPRIACVTALRSGDRGPNAPQYLTTCFLGGDRAITRGSAASTRR